MPRRPPSSRRRPSRCGPARTRPRSGSLVAGGWASRQANDQAIADCRKADAAVVSAQAQKAAAQQQLDVLGAQVVQAQARRQNAAAAVTAGREQPGLHRDPRAVRRHRRQSGGGAGPARDAGDAADRGRAACADKLYVVANFKETQLRRMRPGMKVRLIPDIDSDAAVDGRVDSLAPATGALFSLLPPENATGNFTKVVQRVPVKLVIDPAQAAHADWLRAGLSVTAEVDTRGPDAAAARLVRRRRCYVGPRAAMNRRRRIA